MLFYTREMKAYFTQKLNVHGSIIQIGLQWNHLNAHEQLRGLTNCGKSNLEKN